MANKLFMSSNVKTQVLSGEFYRYRVLMGAMTRADLIHTVRMWCTAEELQRLDQIAQAWVGASTRMMELATTHPGEPDRIAIDELPPNLQPRLSQIEADPIFEKTFAALPVNLKLVEIDKLVAPQRDVNLDYVEEISARIPGRTPEQLLDFCLAPQSAPPEFKLLQTAQNQLIVTSKSLDLRFLGGFRKPLGKDDVAVAHGGGQPAEVVSLLIGFGAATINVFQAGTRLVLNNGFHRVIAMRAAGITHIPVAIQYVAEPQISFPAQLLGLSREYLLGNPRPVLIKDFFDNALTIELHLTPRRKTLKVGWGSEDSVIPV